MSFEVGNWRYSNVEYAEQEHGKGMNRNECRESNELLLKSEEKERW